MTEITTIAHALLSRAKTNREVAKLLGLRADRNELLRAAEHWERLAKEIQSRASQTPPLKKH